MQTSHSDRNENNLRLEQIKAKLNQKLNGEKVGDERSFGRKLRNLFCACFQLNVSKKWVFNVLVSSDAIKWLRNRIGMLIVAKNWAVRKCSRNYRINLSLITNLLTSDTELN